MDYRVRQINMGLHPSAPTLSRKRSEQGGRQNMTKKQPGGLIQTDRQTLSERCALPADKEIAVIDFSPPLAG